MANSQKKVIVIVNVIVVQKECVKEKKEILGRIS